MGNITGRKMSLIDNNTGELLDTIAEDEKIIIRSAKQTENDKYWSERVEINKRFIKTMMDEPRVAKAFWGCPTAYLVMGIIKGHIGADNMLLKDGKKYKPSDFARDVGCSRQTASLYFDKLKQANFLAEYKTKDKGTVWVVNPDYYLVGQTVPKNIVRLFERR